MLKRFTTLLRESARRGTNPSFIYKTLIETAVKGRVLLLKKHIFFPSQGKNPVDMGIFFFFPVPLIEPITNTSSCASEAMEPEHQ